MESNPENLITYYDNTYNRRSGLGLSLPGTPKRAEHWEKEYASETEIEARRGEVGGRRRRRRRRRRMIMKEKWIESAKELQGKCRVLLKSECPNSGPICMDFDELRASRELGFKLSSSSWTVEIPSSPHSPIGSWSIINPGDEPEDVKERLKTWAQAMALTMVSDVVLRSNID